MTGTKINQKVGQVEMDMLVQAALDDPRPGDIFHEMYSYGVQVLAVDDEGVHWRSFHSEEIGRGVETRDKWSRAFRYGDHMPGKHTMYLLERGPAPTPLAPGAAAEPEHECGRDFDSSCSGCVTAMSDAYGSDRSWWPL